MTKNNKQTHKLTKITILRQKINRKKEIILAILSKHSYECHYPDPNTCPKYNPKTGLCIDPNIRCTYRKKLRNSY